MTFTTYEKLAFLAQSSPVFKHLQDFVLKVRNAKNRETCILLCRAEMPKIGDSLREVFGDIPIVGQLKTMPIVPDAVVISSLNTLIEALTDGIEESWKRMEESR